MMLSSIFLEDVNEFKTYVLKYTKTDASPSLF
jgi:hypothetical protein